MFKKTTLKILAATIAMLTVLPAMVCVGASAEENLYCGDLQYEIAYGEVYITGVKSEFSGELVIPSTIDECPVVGVNELAFYECKNITSVTFPDTMTKIKKNAFMSCTELVSIELGDGLEVIGQGAFLGCSKLKDIHFSQDGKLNTIGAESFKGCKSLEAISFPNSVVKLEDGAFWNCDGISEIDLNKVAYLGTSVFGDCDGLIKVEVPESVNAISDTPFAEYNGVFWGCRNMQYFVLFGSMTNVPKGMLWDARELKKMYIDKGNLESIHDEAFIGCEKLTDVFFSGTKAEWDAIATDKVLSENVVVHYNATYDESIFDEEVSISGDVNGDDKVNIKDATTIQKSAAKLLTLTEEEALRADVNNDGKVNVKDATAIQKYLAKIDTGLNIGISI